MHSFARIKPSSADKAGGSAAARTISGWDETAGRVEFSSSKARSGCEAYEHFERTFGPETTQVDAYRVVCAPLVAQWLDGFDADLICYGQTGSGKTYTQFGPPKSMAAADKALGKEGGLGTSSPECIVQPEHGFILRTGFDALDYVSKVNARPGEKAVLHGSMVEMSIMSVSSQNAGDLLAGKRPCFVDKHHHLEGAVHKPITDARDLVSLAAAVETRLTRVTKMNNSSSRSHCVTVFTLHHRDEEGNVRASRFQFSDFMGSERFSGANSAHGHSGSVVQPGLLGATNHSLQSPGGGESAATEDAKRWHIQKMAAKDFSVNSSGSSWPCHHGW